MVGAGPGTRPDPGALLSRHPEWIRRFARRSAFQAELHGMFHVDFASGDAREFAALDRDQALARVDAGLAEFERAGFPPPAVLAPPGWAVTPALLEALAKRNLALAGSFIGPDGVRRAGLPLARPWRPEVQQGVMQLPRHCSIERFDPAGLDSLVGLGAVIGFHAHYRSFGVRNSLTPANLSGLARSLEHLGQTGPVEFCFARELAAVVPR
jgi:hypothetical protein